MRFVRKIDANTVEVQKDKKLIFTKEQVEKKITFFQNQIIFFQGREAQWQAIKAEFNS